MRVTDPAEAGNEQLYVPTNFEGDVITAYIFARERLFAFIRYVVGTERVEAVKLKLSLHPYSRGLNHIPPANVSVSAQQ